MLMISTILFLLLNRANTGDFCFLEHIPFMLKRLGKIITKGKPCNMFLMKFSIVSCVCRYDKMEKHLEITVPETKDALVVNFTLQTTKKPSGNL